MLKILVTFQRPRQGRQVCGQLQKRIDAVKKKNKSSDKDLKKALIMCAYNDETFGTYKSALQESMLNQLGYTNCCDRNIRFDSGKSLCQWNQN